MPAATADIDEIREGSESSISPAALRRKNASRKRSAKNAKQTAAPMDSECCQEKEGKSKCSACAAGKPCSGAKHDSLSTQDILDAYDLGISDRPPSYIRARLDVMKVSTGGRGKKCGGSYISANATCHNGQEATPKEKGSKLRRGLEVAGRAGGIVTTGLGAGMMVHALRKGNLNALNRGASVMSAGNALEGAAMMSAGKRTGNKALVKAGATRVGFGVTSGLINAGLSGDIETAGRAVGRAVRTSVSNATRRRNTVTSGQRARRSARGAYSRYGRGGIWADGFASEMDQLQVV